MEEEQEKPHWTVDRRIPLAFVIAIVLQSIAFIYVGSAWKADTENRLANLEKFEAAISSTRPINLNRLTILEQKFDFIQQTLSRIERKLEERQQPQ